MSNHVRITEYLDVDLDSEMWCCHKCGAELYSARENYKKGCLLFDRDPRTLYAPATGPRSPIAPNPEWCRYIEFYCPKCAALIEVEVLPPGHPLTWDIQLDLDSLHESASTRGTDE